MALSKEEIELLVKKLREKYTSYAEKYNPNWFDIKGFEERLLMSRNNKMNLEGFILAEISNFEKIKQRFDKKKSAKSFSEKVDKIIEENIARIKKYPEIKFHPKAGIEITHIYGALAEFERYYFTVLRALITDSNARKGLNDFEERLEYLAMPRGNLPSRRIEDHALVLSRRSVQEIEIEKDRNDYLKESAFILHEIIGLCDNLIERKYPELETPFLANKIFIEESRKKRVVDIFSGMTGYGVIFKIRDQASNIIEDFRLGAFKRIV